MPPATIRPSCLSCVPRNQFPPRPPTDRTNKSPPRATTHTVTDCRSVPSGRTDAICSSSSLPILSSSSLFHCVIGLRTLDRCRRRILLVADGFAPYRVATLVVDVEH